MTQLKVLKVLKVSFQPPLQSRIPFLYRNAMLSPGVRLRMTFKTFKTFSGGKRRRLPARGRVIVSQENLP